ncbi:imidazolonepropionase [Youngiibacter multivorans]|uniref:Imidazolonepropionase n=1 Tax=Youngiibacter multivorans TaxID=937251 RepID=A0ABS4G3Y2_9CLOT|nr:imidazolonepropionase [Youngiibacter multivorans]MBP1919253.1 imidazolonepropionase [Youngiibacter multivorans]
MEKDKLIYGLASLATPLGNTPKGGSEQGRIVEMIRPSVILSGGKISRVLSESEAGMLETGDYEVIDGTGMTLLPGFVDPHTHLVFGGTREEEFSMRLRGESYMEIMKKGGGIASSVAKTKGASFEDLLATTRKHLMGMASHGITTVEAKSGYGLDKETELKQLRVVKKLNDEGIIEIVSTFMGAHSVPPEYKGRESDFLDMLIEDVLPSVKEEDLAEFCDIFCEKGVFSVEDSREYLKKCNDMGFRLKLHADEMSDLGGAYLAAEIKAISADHLLKASEKGLQAMKEAGVIPVLLPLTAFSLKEEYADGRWMIDMGLPVALGTDFNPGSSYSYSIPLMAALACLQMRLTPEEMLTALTLNSACAIGRGERKGTIEEGKDADLVLIDASSYRFLPYHFGVNQAAMTIKAGKVIYTRSDDRWKHMM